MNRKIKFRAWHKADRKMCEVYGFSRSQWFIEGKRFPMPPGAIEILQYTEVIDINEKLIYEGDIVERYSLAFGETRTFTGEVKMYEGTWWIDNGSAAVPLWNEMNELKIIGNIYENPELLEARE